MNDLLLGPPLATVDWLIILAFLSLSLAIGFLVKNKADQGGIEGYFVAGRELRWWLIGTSMVATSFASDTPLVVTGWVAKYGIAGNWFWWGGAIGTMAVAVFFARRWRDSGVVTDAELCELRYGGKAATLLRTVKATLSATVVNCIVLGWVIAGMAKIAEPFLDWKTVLGPSLFAVVGGLLPDFLVFNNLDNTITILLLMLITLTYSTMGGLRAVIFTDFLQFALAMTMSVIISVLVVQHVGGLEAMWQQLAVLYPDQAPAQVSSQSLTYSQITSFIPDFGAETIGSLGMPFSAFLMTLGVLWWTNSAVDGSGSGVQRIYAARDGEEAGKGVLWYGLAHFVLRTWPWILVGIAALVVYPRDDVNRVAREFTQCIQSAESCTVEMQQCLQDRHQCQIKEYMLLYRTETGAGSGVATDPGMDSGGNEVFKDDRERAYPALLRLILPAGLTGLALVSLMGAFMSTVSTQINWGASYLVNDVYLRFINRRASDRKLVLAGRAATLLMTLLGVYVASLIESIGAMWELVVGIMAGLGLPHLLRWFWWRSNAWTEIAGMLTGFVLALVNYLYGQSVGFPEGQISILPISMASHPIHVITWISMTAAVTAIVATLVTAPVDAEQLRKFVKKAQPVGFWKDYQPISAARRGLASSLQGWLLGAAGIYAGLFGLGYLLRLEIVIGTFLLAISGLAILGLVRLLKTIHGPDSLLTQTDKHRE